LQLRKRRPLDTHKLIAHLLLLFLSLACLLPLWMIVAASFSDDIALTREGFGLLPRGFSTAAYDYIFREPLVLLRAYGVTLFSGVAGTIGAVLIMALIAYPLSRAEFSLRKPLSFYMYFTMLFSGGLIPFYLLMTVVLGLRNNILSLILPGMLSPFLVLILRTYFRDIPDELLDAARIDGAGEWRIFFQIVLPLARPALGTISLLVFLGYWNDWQGTLLFITDRTLYQLQYLLYDLLQTSSAAALNPRLSTVQLPQQPLRMAMVVLATGPAALVFLFFQKYLVRGITVGSLK
jgi:putative aldouronate transport system permease protein